MEKRTLVVGVAAIALLGGAFFGGTMYEKNSLQSQGLLRSGNAQARGAAGGGMGRNGGARPGMGGFTTGQILSKDDTSITVQSPDGGSKVVYISGTTAIRKADPGTATDLSSGERVMVNGKSNPDGTVAADSVEILPPAPSTPDATSLQR